MTFFSSFSAPCGDKRNVPYITINGRRIRVENGIHGRDIANMAGGPKRRTVVVGKGEVKLLNIDKHYKPSDLVDKRGNPIIITSIPDRTKGMFFQASGRTQYSRAIITEQVYDLAAKFVRGSVDFDEDNADWMVIPAFRLPAGWGQPNAPMMILFPQDYPTTPPIGFYLPNYLRSPNQHFFSQAYHGASAAPIQEGWNWYCCTVNDGAWRPYPARLPGEWIRGDNLWTYITLINEVLGSPLNAD